jgi:hypothetical protein
MESFYLSTEWNDELSVTLNDKKVEITTTESNGASTISWLDAKDVEKLINVLISFQKELE